MRRRIAVVGLVIVAACVVAALALTRGGTHAPRARPPGAGTTETTVDPIAWDADRKAELERRAAAGLAHVLYAKSPGGAVVSAARTATWGAPLARGAHGAAPDRPGRQARAPRPRDAPGDRHARERRHPRRAGLERPQRRRRADPD